MRARTTKLSAIGAAIGLVLAATVAVAPASAAPGVKTAITSSCSAFNGRTVTGTSPSYSGIAMRTGDVITATVSPAREGDYIRVLGSNGLDMIIAEGSAVPGYAWSAPADAVYNLTWVYRTAGTVPAQLTWSFTSSCSTVSVTPNPDPSPSSPTKPGKGKGGKGKG